MGANDLRRALKPHVYYTNNTSPPVIECPQKQLNILGVKVPLTALSSGNRRSRRNFFKVSEEKVVTGSQVWTVGLSSTKPRFRIAGVFNPLSSRANLHLSYNPAGRSHCRLQNHHGIIKHHHRGMGGSPGDVGEVPMT